MSNDIEIETKQLLNKEQYLIIKKEILNHKHTKINQVNYYFETDDYYFKNNNQALRIRVYDDKYEICLKTRANIINYESNYLISKDEFESIKKDTSLFSKYFNDIPRNIKLLGSLNTIRIEYKINKGLICLDYSTYFNKEDYEIEFEANNLKDKYYLKEYLNSLNIEFIENKITKIERFSNELKLISNRAY
ncbi:MAG: CYTH domain-containing protein [Bacilli bacterium]|jgi:uncharacterized protein YjbK|nr:CYTH domain-containing protein [Bacilli bacterium]